MNEGPQVPGGRAYFGTTPVPGRARAEFARARVMDAMRAGVITCPPDASLQMVAHVMATYHVHAVLIPDVGPEGTWGMVSDLDLFAAETGEAPVACARDVSSTPLITVEPNDGLRSAAERMVENGITHLVVVEPGSGRPVGMLSSLDLAAALARG